MNMHSDYFRNFDDAESRQPELLAFRYYNRLGERAVAPLDIMDALEAENIEKSSGMETNASRTCIQEIPDFYEFKEGNCSGRFI